jgi:hypothetical protein
MAPTSPSPGATSVDVQAAKRDSLRQAKRKRGVQSTILAGETGGYAAAGAGGGKTLLGG